ncbi:unnamed protein product [Bursaphelenchus xylophilus]|uniref:(pine wood nematode) hypothetical protein n=1 Tax=Bursaphelenchus xylophilus TaxID=6326 RepID=A0A1I7SEJ3_BURXY|nr:unnamed protein product [Bursaphelenchus xylophilus]CAG9113559.1 unnamed protein product [Bursaphelenchus xylophilus]
MREKRSKPGVIQSEHMNRLIVEALKSRLAEHTAKIEEDLGVSIPYYQLGLFADDQELSPFDDMVTYHYTNFPQDSKSHPAAFTSVSILTAPTVASPENGSCWTRNR